MVGVSLAQQLGMWRCGYQGRLVRLTLPLVLFGCRNW